MADCARCGASLPEGAQFCPSCGLKVGEDPTTAQPLPPHETSASPKKIAWSMPRYFGLTPPTLAFGIATASLAIAIVLAILEHWVGALVLAACSLLFLALYVGVARRKPDTALARSSARAVDRVRERTAWMIEAVAIRSGAGRELAHLRQELLEDARRRETLLRDLGAAVYGDDGEARQTLVEGIASLDHDAARKEAEMRTIVATAEERLERGRLSVQETMVEPAPPPPPEPVPPVVPEPAPPPDEGTPPTPAPIPEPYPPPDEGTPPQPDPVPEQDQSGTRS